MGDLIATNKKAYRDYFFTDRYECGIELIGAEVKSVRDLKVNFTDAFARVEEEEIFLYNLQIEPYAQASFLNSKSDRPRRLLLHKKEIRKLFEAATVKHLALVPTKIYFNAKGRVKIELAVGKGKKMYDKRETMKNRDIDRDIGRALRNRNAK
ncbi:MAG: SsrA-binding protein SmpB [Candidatus Omnitrophica bacterium]|nr:SsrA-binding protein SmpB [Candidatus Omnitrophota bacterium]